MMNKVKYWWANHKPTKRRVIQLYAALLTNANLKGFGNGKIYQGNIKTFCVPGLNCYSCPAASAACPLGALQNALANADKRMPYYVFGILILYGLLFGRWICGFLCPFGLIQDLLYKIRTPKLRKNKVTKVLSWLKYGILAIFVILIPLIYGLQATAVPMPAFCKFICPSGTLLGAGGLLSNEVNNDLFAMLGPLFTWKFCLLVAIIVACVFCYRSFCRFLCPLGAIYGLFNKVSLIGLNLDRPKCVECGKCIGVCKMDIRHVGDHECISCGDCIAVCPTGAISRKGPKILLTPNEVGGPTTGKEVPAPLPRKTKLARRIVGAVMALVLIVALVYYNVPAPQLSSPGQSSQPSGSGNTGNLPPEGNQVGNLCYDYELKLLLEDGSLNVSDYRGKITVINFWATWCTACVHELEEEFPALYEEYGDRITVLAVHSYDGKDDMDNAQFVQDHFGDTPYIYCLDDAGETYATMLCGGQVWPSTVILDENGVVIGSIVGGTTFETLKSIIDASLND